MPAVRRPAASNRKPSSRRTRRLGTVLLVGLLALLLSAPAAFAEGSADLNIGPGTALRNRLVVNGGNNAPNKTGYTVLHAYARAGETIDMGSSAMKLGGSADILVYAPGTNFASATEPGRRATLPTDPVFATDVFSCDASDPGIGWIENRTQELAGPAPNTNGYTPCQYVAPADGVYAIVMFPYVLAGGTFGTSTVNVPDTSTGQGPALSIWDVTVRDAGVEQSGRVFTDAFEFLVPTAGGNASNLSTFV
jgi:hypothetical protein